MHYAETFGWKIFPADVAAKKSFLSAKFAPDGANWGMTNDVKRLRKSWRIFPAAGIGLPTGPENKIFVVEADTLKGHGVDGVAALRELAQKYGGLPLTLTATSPSGSIHFYFNYPENTKIKTQDALAGHHGVDVRGEGGMVIAPPSQRDDGDYKWVNDEEIVNAPNWLIELAREQEEKTNGHDPFFYTREPVSIEELHEAVRAISNVDRSWAEWNRVGMAIYSSAPGADGFEIFDEWSKKYSGYNAKDTKQRWRAYSKSPPSQISVGTLFYLADESNPDWRHKEEEKVDNDEKPPVDFWDLAKPPELPTGLLPDVIEEFARTKAKLMGADPAGLAIAALCCCGAAIPDSVIKIKPKRHEHWTESARIWVSVIGDVSTMKSPIISAAARPLKHIDNELARNYANAMRDYNELKGDEKRSAEKPPHIRVMISDSTPAAVQPILQDSPDGVLCYRDELAGWFGSIEQFASKGGSGADRSFWLESWNGGAYTFDRAGRGTGHIPNLSISFLGGIQPDVIRKFNDLGNDDGLIQRLIPVMLNPAGQERDEESPPVEATYEGIIRWLYSLRDRYVSEEIVFSEAAQKIRVDVAEKNRKQMLAHSVGNEKLRGHIGKYNAIFPRLCLIWHCIEHRDDASIPKEISQDTAERVAKFMYEYLFFHALEFYGGVLELSEEHTRLKKVAGYILTKKLTEVTNRIVQMSVHSMRNMGRRNIENIFEQLSAFGWLYRVPPRRAGDPAKWKVNPRVHREFVHRTKQEEKLRAELKATLQENVSRRQEEKHYHG